MTADRVSKRLLDVAADAVGTVVGVTLAALMIRGVALGQLYGYVIGFILVASSTYLLVAMIRRRRRAARSPAISAPESLPGHRTPQQPA